MCACANSSWGLSYKGELSAQLPVLPKGEGYFKTMALMMKWKEVVRAIHGAAEGKVLNLKFLSFFPCKMMTTNKPHRPQGRWEGKVKSCHPLYLDARSYCYYFTLLGLREPFPVFPSGLLFSSVQFSSVAQSYLTLCDPMNRSTPGLPVHHQLPEFTQTHIHRVGDAIQPSHPLSSSSPPAPNPSQHQSLFQWVNSSHEVAKVLEFQL